MIDFSKEPEKEEKTKEPIYKSVMKEMELPAFRAKGSKQFCIFKVGNKIYNSHHVHALEHYLKREVEVNHADPTKKHLNKFIYGSENLAKDFMDYVAECPKRKNTILGREIMVTASPSFFNNLSTLEFDKWIEKNKQFLLGEFGNNLRYLHLHMDETVPHLHAVITTKFFDTKVNANRLQHYKYFNGRKMFIELQDRYAATMSKEFKLERGQKTNVDVSYIDIKNVYQAIANPDMELDHKTAAHKAQLLEIKVKNMENKLKAIQSLNQSFIKDNEKLQQENSILRAELEKNKAIANYLKEANFLSDKDINNLVKTNKQSKDSLSL